MDWYLIVAACIATALTVRVDALLIGPYFSFRAVIFGWEGVDGEYWYESEPLRWALTRRLSYPFLLGMILALSGLERLDVALAGALVAGLLIWPAAFVGLPTGLSARDWQVGATFGLLIGLFFGLALGGWIIVELMRSAADGSVWDYFFGLVRDWLITAILVGFGIAFFKGVNRSLRTTQRGRQDSGPGV